MGTSPVCFSFSDHGPVPLSFWGARVRCTVHAQALLATDDRGRPYRGYRSATQTAKLRIQ